MEDLESYLKLEYGRDIHFAASKIGYSHSVTINSKGIMNHISIKIKLFDKDLKELCSEIVKFTNDALPAKKKFKYISENELTNKYLIARLEIIKMIYEDYDIKMKLIKEDVDKLSEFAKMKLSQLSPLTKDISTKDIMQVPKIKYDM